MHKVSNAERRTLAATPSNQNLHDQAVLFILSLILLPPFKRMGWFLTPVVELSQKKLPAKSHSSLSFLSVAIRLYSTCYCTENNHCSSKRGHLQYGQLFSFWHVLQRVWGLSFIKGTLILPVTWIKAFDSPLFFLFFSTSQSAIALIQP